jgi:hypothetical protein
MSPDAWPSPDAQSGPLPRIEDLPIAEQGYEQDAVRAAFDSFYRHAAQLDAALRTLEAVDSFHRQAAALRADLRALRTAGWTQQPWSGAPPYGYATRAPREGISPAVWRIAGEVVFLIAVSVVLGVAKLPWWVIVLVMAAAFLIIVVIEWTASREPFVVSRAPEEPEHPVVDVPSPGERTESEPVGWTAFEESQEPSDAMTMIAGPPPPAVEAADVAPDDHPAVEEADEVDEPDAEPVAAEVDEEREPVAEEQRRRRWWRRGDEASEEPSAVEPPSHVRVIGAADPWEQGLDGDEAAEQPAEPDEDTGEDAAALAGDGEPTGRRRFRRR